MRAVRAVVLSLSALLFTPGLAVAGVVPVASVTASSTYPEGGYGPERVADGKQGTAWVEGEDGAGLGAWIELNLGGDHRVDTLRVWAGDWYDDTSWKRANRPKELEIKLSDGHTEVVALKDAREVQEFALGGRTASTVRVRIKSTYAGSTWLDTGISEIQVLGDGTPPGHVATLSASSHAPADGDGTYVAANAADQLDDSMWCEGDAGDGTGQTLTFDFGAPRSVSTLTWINGIGTSLPLWMKANRATAITLGFDGGATHALEVKPSPRAQTLTFPAQTTSKVTITFGAVMAGKEFNDLCVSEAWFSGS